MTLKRAFKIAQTITFLSLQAKQVSVISLTASCQVVCCCLNKYHPVTKWDLLAEVKGLAGVTTVNWVTSVLIWLQSSDQWNHQQQGHWHPALSRCWVRISPQRSAPKQNAAVRVLRPDRWECSTPISPSPDYSHHCTHAALTKKCTCQINILRLVNVL